MWYCSIGRLETAMSIWQLIGVFLVVIALRRLHRPQASRPLVNYGCYNGLFAFLPKAKRQEYWDALRAGIRSGYATGDEYGPYEQPSVVLRPGTRENLAEITGRP